MAILGPPSEKAHWSAKFVYSQMRINNITQSQFLRRSGYPRTTFQRWMKGTVTPRVDELENCLAVFGYQLKPTFKVEEIEK